MEIGLPGKFLGTLEQYVPKAGTYVMGDKIYSSLAGKIEIKEETEGEQKKTTIKVIPKQNRSSSVVPSVGDLVIARVARIMNDRINVNILCINDVPLKQQFTGVVKLQEIRRYDTDKIVTENCFLPGDIIKAEVISMGDSRSFFLSTAQNHLGVMFARHQESRELMVPVNWETMKCPVTNLEESRKVAKPEL
mmetsp:Transcript_18817/g.21257  ORF Transcript_18817/g.21257 Transcript_18817/m.21257 type:complete len:192 (+) Transcript_18817:80-655(+)